MRTAFKMAAAVALSLTMPGEAAAAARCEAPDLAALNTAALQQELMVAALTCRASGDYNAFVSAYRPDLIAADARVASFFTRQDGRAGLAGYNAFKTRLANDSSLHSLADIGGYCADAQAIFATALPREGLSLADLIAALPGTDADVASACEAGTRS